MAARHNKRAKPSPYEVGDLVLLLTKGLNLKGYDVRKLYPLYLGPFQVNFQVKHADNNSHVGGLGRLFHNLNF